MLILDCYDILLSLALLLFLLNPFFFFIEFQPMTFASMILLFIIKPKH